MLADLATDPERDRRADHRARRGENRIQPEQLGLARGQNDDREIDSQRQEEDERRVERAHHEEAAAA